MKPLTILLTVLALGAVVAGASHVHLHNELVALDVAAESQWKQVENQLARQHELLPKLATVANRYVDHERAVLASLFEARERYLESGSDARPARAAAVDGAVTELLALGEAYPELRADAQYRDLTYEIAGTKNRIAVERKRYNDAVAALNTRLRQLPWRLAAAGIDTRAFYQADATRLAEPELDL